MEVQFVHPFQEAEYDLFEWYEKLQSCVRYFVDTAQYTHPVQAVAARVNIKLPHQNPQTTVFSTLSSPSSSATPSSAPSPSVLVVPYVRRLVATSFDTPHVLHGFFGDDWEAGVRPICERERRNFCFAVKSKEFSDVKMAYDMEDGQVVTELTGPYGLTQAEIECWNGSWSKYMALQDWEIDHL